MILAKKLTAQSHNCTFTWSYENLQNTAAWPMTILIAWLLYNIRNAHGFESYDSYGYVYCHNVVMMLDKFVYVCSVQMHTVIVINLNLKLNLYR